MAGGSLDIGEFFMIARLISQSFKGLLRQCLWISERHRLNYMERSVQHMSYYAPPKNISEQSSPAVKPLRTSGKEDFIRCLKGLEKAIVDNDMDMLEGTIKEFFSLFPGSKNHNFINKTIEAFMRASKLDRAKEFYLSVVNGGFAPDERTMVVLLDGYLRHSDINHAKEVMRSLGAFKLAPTIKMMNVWMSYYLKEHQLEKARSLFKNLETQGLTPNLITFLNFMKFFLRNSDFISAQRLRTFMKSQNIKLDVHFYNAIIKILFQKQALGEVDNALAEMKEAQIAADLNTFNVLIEGYASVNMLDKAQELIKEMPEAGFKPSIMTFNRLLSSQAYALNVEQTQEILIQMNKFGLVFNAYTYVGLFKGLLAKQKYTEAISMLFKMEDSKVSVPVEVFSDLVKICCDHNLDGAVYLLRTQLVKYNLYPSSHVYTSLVKYYLRHRNYKQVDGLLLAMQRRNNMKPSLHIFCTLLNHFVEVLDIERIGQTLTHLKEMKLELNKVVYNVVMKAFYVHCKCLDGGLVYRADLKPSTEFPGRVDLVEPASRRTTVAKIKQSFEETFGIPFKPTIHVFNDLMNYFFHSARYVEALECFDEILRCELAPNMNTMTLLIKSRLYLGQVGDAQQVISQMPRYGLTPSVLQCALVHHALCRQLLTDEAEVFLQEIISTHHIKINYVFYASLMYAYSRRYEHSKVFRTFEKLQVAGFVPDTETCNYILISLFEVGQYNQAYEFFQRMITQDIRRNNYTYAIMADRYLIRHDATRLMSYLDDSLLPGNSIDAFPFNKLLRFYYDHSEMSKLSEVIAKMVQLSVRFNWETWQYVNYVFYRAIDSPDSLNFAKTVLQKALVDLEPGEGFMTQLVDALKDIYTSLGDNDALRAWCEFEEKLPELRLKITEISPNLRDNIMLREYKNVFGRSIRRRSLDDSAESLIAVEDSDTTIPLENVVPVDMKAELDILAGQMMGSDGARSLNKEMESFMSNFLTKDRPL